MKDRSLCSRGSTFAEGPRPTVPPPAPAAAAAVDCLGISGVGSCLCASAPAPASASARCAKLRTAASDPTYVRAGHVQVARMFKHVSSAHINCGVSLLWTPKLHCCDL